VRYAQGKGFSENVGSRMHSTSGPPKEISAMLLKPNMDYLQTNNSQQFQ
jgi:hypothetical protein